MYLMDLVKVRTSWLRHHGIRKKIAQEFNRAGHDGFNWMHKFGNLKSI